MFALFKSIFLINRSLSNDRWFCSVKRKIGKGKLYLTKNQFGRNKICCAEDNSKHMSKMICVKKNSQIRTLIKRSLATYWFFKKLPQISHIHKSHNFSSIIPILQTNCFYLDKFHGNSMRRILFFNFASCEPLGCL